jgi:hypothetical protein
MSKYTKIDAEIKTYSIPKTARAQFRIVAAKMRLLIDCCFSGLGRVITAIFGYVIWVLVI